MQVSHFTDFWFQNPQMWFANNPSIDSHLHSLFYPLFLEITQLPLSSIYEKDKEYIMGCILIHDQLSRHFFRNEKDKIAYYDERAISLFECIQDKIEEFEPTQRCFLLLPYRHSKQKDKIDYVFSLIQQFHLESPHIKIYQRFYKATLLSLSSFYTLESSSCEYQPPHSYSFDEIQSILDIQSTYMIPEHIDCTHESIYSLFCQEMEQNIQSHESKIIISLSGGVDSMVVSYLLYQWNLQHQHKYELEAITIDYANRQEQKIEIYMVNEWCKKLGIKHYVREIKEIHRSRDADREIYEEVTRKIRFDMYKQRNGIVLVGHNKDDSLENVMNNIKKRQSYFNLYGMNSRMEEKEVTIVRPILKIWKRDILQFAIKYHIPFVYDSTPSWSERGKMRDILIPQMRSFSEEMVEGIFDMVDNYREIYKIYETMIPIFEYNEKECKPLLGGQPRKSTNSRFCRCEDRNIYFYEYLKKIVYRMMQHYELKPIKNRAILNMSECFQQQKWNRVTLSKECIVERKDGYFNFYIFE
jgi:tRNA(Ile)-lysidine synthetase-like protein